jgi:hypothetical protein
MQQYLSKPLEVLRARIIELSLLLLGLYVGFFTLIYSQNEDMGIFLSETSLIAKGHGVYSEIFEVKDPLFLWLGGLTNYLFGLKGPYLVDVFFVAISPLVAYNFARIMKLSPTWASIVAVTFCGSLAGTYYQTLRTGTIALVLVVVNLTFVYKRKWITSGVFCVLVVGFKMAYAPLLIGVFFFLITSPQRIKAVRNFSLAASATSSLIIAILWWRGELNGFIDMVKLNFHYREVFPAVVGFRPGMMGHVDVINANASSFIWLILGILFLSVACFALTRKSRDEFMVSASLLITFVGVVIFLLTSAMWVHHLQPLSIIALCTSALVGKIFSIHVPNMTKPVWVSVLAAFLFLMTLNTTGWKLPVKPSSPVAMWLAPHWNIPPEIEYLKLNASEIVMKKTFARLGPNDDLGLAAFLPKDWQLSCRDYAHYGHETEELVTDIIACLRTKPNYVLVSPGFLPLVRLSGTYEQLKSSSTDVLSTYFKCVPIMQRSGAQFCSRIKS